MATSTALNDNKPNQLPLKRVLIVEDDSVMQLGERRFFLKITRISQVVEIVADGFLAVKAPLKIHPDLIIMDIGLPQMDGTQVKQLPMVLTK